MGQEVTFDPDTLEDDLRKKFGDVVIAVAMKDDFAFYAVYSVLKTDDAVSLQLFPSPEKNFSLEVTGLHEDSDRQWSITTPRQVWLLRPPVEADGARFREAMKGAGAL
jgi:hypothetical protein